MPPSNWKGLRLGIFIAAMTMLSAPVFAQDQTPVGYPVQGLSIRRVKAVQAELVRDVVPEAAIAIQGFGETHLLVPTGPGVREPQNHRVEIIIK